MSNERGSTPADLQLAHTVQVACIKAAKEAFRDASMSGLCTDGAIEAAIGAIQSLDMGKIVAEAKQPNK